MSDVHDLFEQLAASTAIPATSEFEQGIVKKLYQEIKPISRIERARVGNSPPN
jgi:hypothetical protein